MMALHADVQTPPHDPGAEAAVLTACILSPERATEALSVASPDDFFSGGNRAIALCVAELVAEGTPSDATAVESRLLTTGRLALAGGHGALIRLMEAVPAISNPARYAATVRDLARVRRAQHALHRVLAESYEPMPDVPAWFARLDATIGEHTRQAVTSTVATAKEAAIAMAREMVDAGKPSIPTGFARLDDRLAGRGLVGSRLYIVGGRTGMGKSAFAGNIAHAAAKAGACVLYVSLEMPKEELTARLLCADAGVPCSAYTDKRLTPSQIALLTRAASEFARLAFHIDASTSQTLLHVRATAQRIKPDLVVVDHIGLLKSSGHAGRKRHEVVAEFSRGLKTLAMELDKPVIALSQIGREVAKEARRPTISDLRESGDVEQDADTILLIHRPGYYDLARGDSDPEAEVIIGKQRAGRTGLVPFMFENTFTRFTEVADV